MDSRADGSSGMKLQHPLWLSLGEWAAFEYLPVELVILAMRRRGHIPKHKNSSRTAIANAAALGGEDLVLSQQGTPDILVRGAMASKRKVCAISNR